MAEGSRKQGQRHGDGRAVLLRAATEALEEVGAAGLSLRGVAERAGLSRQAPYNHFTSKEAMLAALAVGGFEQLGTRMRGATAGKTGTEALAAAGEAYVALAQTAPSLFRLMFSRELVDVAAFPDAAAASADAFSALVTVVSTMCPSDRVEEVSLAAWCIVHGYATLCNEAGLETPDRRSERVRQFTHLFASSDTVVVTEDRKLA